MKPSLYSHNQNSSSPKNDINQNKLANIIYHNGDYYFYEPCNTEQNKYNIIDNHLWLIARYMPNHHIEVQEGDVIRFGRIPFKIARLVLNPQASSNYSGNNISASEYDI